MPTDPPIACSLSASEQSSRLAEMDAIGRSALLAAGTSDKQATLRFRTGGSTRARLSAIVAAESECCRFLDMNLHDRAKVIELTISAPAGAEPILEELVGAFGGHASRSPASNGRSADPTALSS
jgi:hypothetical protein